MNADTLERPAADLVDTSDRFVHIILEGWTWEDDEGETRFVSVDNSAIDGAVFGQAVKALCGYIWIPNLDDPQGLPLCPACTEVAHQNGWDIPLA